MKRGRGAQPFGPGLTIELVLLHMDHDFQI